MNEARRRTSWVWWLAVIVLWGLIVAILYPVLRDTGGSHPSSTCVNNLHQIALAVNSYMGDWSERLPPISADQSVPAGRAWPDLLRQYVRTEGIFRCPGSWHGCVTYSFNRRASGAEVRYTASPEARALPIVFDSVNYSPKNNNLNGDAIWRSSVSRLPFPGCLVIWPDSQACRDWPKWAQPRHLGRTYILFMDGHVKTADDLISLEFDPKAQEEGKP